MALDESIALTRPSFRLDTPLTMANPLLIGWRAARANFWPGLCLQVVMLLVVLAYYYAPWAKPWFDQLALLKARGGFLFSAVAAMVAGAVLPEILSVLFFQRGRVTARNRENLVFGMVFWAFNGLFVDLLYRGQAVWFGTEPTVPVLIKKVAVDQFVYSAMWSAPLAAWCYEWKNRRYRTEGLSDMFTVRFYLAKILPTTIANWGVWIPGTALIYSLPTLLQIPLFNLALTFWALLLAYINSNGDRGAAQRKLV